MTGATDIPLRASTAEQAQALLDMTYGARLLEKFLEPATASEAARAMNEPANRVTYHVRKLEDCGLLRVAGTRGRSVLYQAAARRFLVPRALLPMHEPLAVVEPVTRRLARAYAAAIAQSHARAEVCDEQTDWAVIAIGPGDQHPRNPNPDVRFPPAMQVRTVSMTPAQYARVQAALSALLDGMEKEDGVPGAQRCTFSVMTFEGHLHTPET